MADSYLRELSVRAGMFTGKATRPRDVEQLVERLRPVAITTPLVRFGPSGDGGYVIPDDLEGINVCYSPGVSTCSDFEWQMAERDIDVYMADRSVDGPATEHPRFHFLKAFLASMDHPEAGLITLDSWVQSTHGHSPQDEFLLQMDIEGSEYEVIHNLSDELLQRFRIMVIEFHRLQQLLDRFSFRWISHAFEKLLLYHDVVHLHPNNVHRTIRAGAVEIPLTMEFVFLRRDRVELSQTPLTFPHPADHPNIPDRPELVLPESWWRK